MRAYQDWLRSLPTTCVVQKLPYQQCGRIIISNRRENLAKSHACNRTADARTEAFAQAWRDALRERRTLQQSSWTTSRRDLIPSFASWAMPRHYEPHYLPPGQVRTPSSLLTRWHNAFPLAFPMCRLSIWDELYDASTVRVAVGSPAFR